MRCGHFQKMLLMTKRFSASRRIFVCKGSSHKNWHSPLLQRKTAYILRDTLVDTILSLSHQCTLGGSYAQSFTVGRLYYQLIVDSSPRCDHCYRVWRHRCCPRPSCCVLGRLGWTSSTSSLPLNRPVTIINITPVVWWFLFSSPETSPPPIASSMLLLMASLLSTAAKGDSVKADEGVKNCRRLRHGQVIIVASSPCHPTIILQHTLSSSSLSPSPRPPFHYFDPSPLLLPGRRGEGLTPPTKRKPLPSLRSLLQTLERTDIATSTRDDITPSSCNPWWPLSSRRDCSAVIIIVVFFALDCGCPWVGGSDNAPRRQHWLWWPCRWPVMRRRRSRQKRHDWWGYGMDGHEQQAAQSKWNWENACKRAGLREGTSTAEKATVSGQDPSACWRKLNNRRIFNGGLESGR